MDLTALKTARNRAADQRDYARTLVGALLGDIDSLSAQIGAFDAQIQAVEMMERQREAEAQTNNTSAPVGVSGNVADIQRTIAASNGEAHG